MPGLAVAPDWFLKCALELFAAVGCGLVLGYERDSDGAPVGMLTCTLVCIGATTSMASGHLILRMAELPGDPTRVAGQITTGIGFLGAGSILRGRAGVTGLSSAAAIWFFGAIGVLVGCGYGLTGFLLTALVTGLSVLPRRAEGVVHRRRRQRVAVDLGEGAVGEVDQEPLLEVLKAHGVLPREFRFESDRGRRWLVLMPGADAEIGRELLVDLWSVEQVEGLEHDL